MISLNRHTLELGTATAIGLLAGTLIYGSLQLDTGWSDTGPQSGYFPLRLGVLLAVVSVLLLAQAARSPLRGSFASADELRRSLAIFGPTLVMVLALPWAGCYLSALVYLVYMARRHGGFGWPASLATGAGAAVAFYAVFDLWFKVQLAKGPIEAWLGLV